MSGNCVWVDIDEGPTAFSEEVRRARKTYRCCECGEEIKPGHLYEYASGKWDGEWGRFRTCARCANVRRDYFKGGWIYGQVVEDFQEAFGFDYRKGIPPDFAPCEDRRGWRPVPPSSPSGTIAFGETP
jgi:hypothetical protein